VDIQILMDPVNVLSAPSLYGTAYLVAGRATMQLTRRESALSCKQRISRAASNAVTNFIRMSDATPRGAQTSVCTSD
jgi:hypothetical protein